MKKRKSLLRSDSFQTLLTSLLCIILGVAIGYVVLLIINPAGAWKSMSALLKNFFHYPAGQAAHEVFRPDARPHGAAADVCAVHPVRL